MCHLHGTANSYTAKRSSNNSKTEIGEKLHDL